MKKINLFLFLILTFVSCQEMPFMQEVTITETAEGLNLLEWYNVLKEPNDGSLRIEASRAIGSQDSPYNKAYLNGYFKNEEGKAIDIGEIEFGNIDMKAGEGNLYRTKHEVEYTENYGNLVNVTVKNETASFYLPKEIKFSQNLYEGSGIEIHPNFVFKWNKDENNKLGVVINISYYAAHNGDIDGSSAIQSQSNYILTDDTGEYSFKNEDFANIPNSSTVSITIMRGGAVVMNTEDNKRFHFSGKTLNSTLGVKVNLEK